MSGEPEGNHHERGLLPPLTQPGDCMSQNEWAESEEAPGTAIA